MNKGRVLMVIHDRYQSDNFLNLGLAYIGAVLLQNNVHVEVFDQAIHHYTNQQLAEFLKENEFDLILVSFLSGRFTQTVKPLCEVINQYKKDAWLCLGGHGASASESYMLRTTNCEIVFTGEGEESVLEVLNCKINGGNLYNVKGIAFKDCGEIVITPHRNPVANLDSLPMPAWDLFEMETYTTNLQFAGMKEGDKAFPLISGRGCTNKCSFCYRIEKGLRARNVQNVIAEMKELYYRFGINYAFFLDELFVFSKKRVYEFANALKKNNLNINYNVNARCDIFDIEIAQILKESGCLFVNAGFETTSDAVLKTMKKNCTVEQNHKTAQACHDVGLGIGLNLLFGFPKDTIQTLWDNVAFIKKYNMYDQCRTLRSPTPYPGSPLLTTAVEMGFIKHEDEFFDVFKNSDLRMFDYCGIPDDVFYSELLRANTELVLDHYKHTNNDMEAAWKIINGYKDLYEGRTIEFYGARSDVTNADKRKIIR
jgi:anaerobic magnesium-protoporphyrin IX monomethyl ester cyclase